MKRKEFLKISGGLALAGFVSPSLTGCASQGEAVKSTPVFGLQLYTLREDFPKDPKGVLKQVAGLGYKEIESFEGPNGMFWGMTNKEFKSYLDGLEMKIVSSHCDMNTDFERKAAEAAEIGMKYLICPWVGPQENLDAYKKLAETFNQKGEICKKNGIRFAYHNHDYSFVKMNEDTGQDVMMKNTDAGTVDFEMDMYWVVTAGEDIEAWLKKYPNRFRLCHVKDRQKGAAADNKDASCDVGTGSIDYAKILKTARSARMEHFIIEQEKYEGTTPLNAAEASAAYMKTVNF
jgi:sugar phosphate isomerase/epimerase